MHKKQQNYPLRPVLSSIRTFNYGLAKALKQMLSSIIKKDTIIKDSFAFVDELKSLKHLSPTSKMVSFDIVSLYTNIPLDETIKIILNHLYNDESPTPSIPKNDMIKLLGRLSFAPFWLPQVNPQIKSPFRDFDLGIDWW